MDGTPIFAGPVNHFNSNFIHTLAAIFVRVFKIILTNSSITCACCKEKRIEALAAKVDIDQVKVTIWIFSTQKYRLPYG